MIENYRQKTILFPSVDEYDTEDHNRRYEESCNLSNVIVQPLQEGQVPGVDFRLHCTHWVIKNCETKTIDGNEIKFTKFSNDAMVYGYLTILETLW